MTMSEQEILRYTTDEPTASEKWAAQGPTEKVMNGLTWAILLICLAIWAVIGAVFWIPLILRTMVRFSAAMAPAMLADKKPIRAAQMLRGAVSFYRRGFEVAIDVVTKEPRRERAEKGEDGGLSGMQFLNEFAWAALIWYGILLFFGAIDLTPIDMWYWVAGIQWNEVLYQPIAEFVDGFRS
jgi:hypothetical protein